MRSEELRAGISEVMGDSPTGKICLELAEKLCALSASQGRFLTYTSLQNLASVNEIDEALVSAVHFLSSSRWAILKPHGQLIDDEGEEFTLSDEEFGDVLMKDEVIHPRTGERIENAQMVVMPFFELSIERCGI